MICAWPYHLGYHATVLFTPGLERIVVDRTKSTPDPRVNTFSEYGRHTLFRKASGLEPLRLRVFYDGSLLEVFANDRFALSTHVYGGACTLSTYSTGGSNAHVEAVVWA